MRSLTSLLPILFSTIACGAPEPEQAPEPEPIVGPKRAVESPSSPVPADSVRIELARRHESDVLDRAFERHFAAAVREHESRARPAYLPSHGLDVPGAEFYRGFVDGFELEQPELEVLHDRGFVVVDRIPKLEEPAVDPLTRPGAGPVDLYYRVFERDLPVFISADSILHAWHRSYDAILERTEERRLSNTLSRVLDAVHRGLDPSAPTSKDARVYIGVARRLLDDVDGDDDTRAEIDAVVAALETERPTTIDFLGRERDIDASQFIVRGHYASSPRLQRYFRAMMWLGRVDLRLFDAAQDRVTAVREEAAARRIADATQVDLAKRGYEEIADYYRAHVGRPQALRPQDLRALCTADGAGSCTKANARALQARYRDTGPVPYAAGDDATPVPASVRRGRLSMRLFPQRFAYDAWVLSKTTAPELVPDGGPGARTMASPLDVAYALGSDRAREHLGNELDDPLRPNLAPTLEAVRRTIAERPPTELDETAYNHWLEALAALAEPRLDPGLPAVLQTAAWHDRRLESVLASWAELRHDTVLVVEQSMGLIGCQYPKGYVEPVPQVYAEIRESAAHVHAIHEALGGKEDPVLDYLGWLQDQLRELERLAKLELAGKPMSPEDLAFISNTVDRHAEGYGGTRSYDGWYAAMYWGPGWAPPGGEMDRYGNLPHIEGGASKPVVTDVHTDLAKGRGLQVATGHPELLIVAIDTPEGSGRSVALYAGPVYGFFTFERDLAHRMVDQQWVSQLDDGPPRRPEFARAYRAQ